MRRSTSSAAQSMPGSRCSRTWATAVPMQMHRHDNIIQRALSLADRLWLCFIADGAHVPFAALGNYLKLASEDRKPSS